MAGLLPLLLPLWAALAPSARALALGTPLARAGAASSGRGALDDVMASLDADKSGVIEPSEVEAFARSQGMSLADAKKEFSSLDTNHDGVLQAEEIRGLVDADAAAATAPASAAPASVVPDAKPDLQAEATAEAEKGAGRALAEVFARMSEKLLDERGSDIAKAAKLEDVAVSLRGRSAELRRTASEQTRQAAMDAAEAVFSRVRGTLELLERQAVEAEQKAQGLRQEALQAGQKAMHAQADIYAILQQQTSSAPS